MSNTRRTQRKKANRFRRARVRNFLFSIGPDRLSGGRVARRHRDQNIRVHELTLSSPRWPQALDGLRIGHVSDFHIGHLHPVAHALEAVELLAAQEPDFVACTGDVVDLHFTDAPPVLAALAAIDAPFGSALVLGNHDELHCGETLRRMAEDAGLLMLQDAAMTVTRRSEPFVVAGIQWSRTAAECARRIEEVCGEETHLLLSHNPRAFPTSAQRGIPLTLAGHTHGGQLALPKRPNANLAMSHRRSAGHFREQDGHLFVTTGVGAWFPLRVNCPPEVAVITMRHAT